VSLPARDAVSLLGHETRPDPGAAAEAEQVVRVLGHRSTPPEIIPSLPFALPQE
jgi:hypothetical protein